ncbi:MAG: hypothetical protein V1750_03765 [Acidobacteriota bacterium]
MPRPAIELPNPLLEPLAGAHLKPAEAKAAGAAFQAASSGDLTRALKRSGKLPAGHPVRTLLELEIRHASGEAVATEALAFAGGAPDYASAWHLAALAARTEGRLTEALLATRRAEALRQDGSLAGLAAELEEAVVKEGVRDASSRLARGDAAGAAKKARQVLDLVPATSSARMVLVGAALALGDLAAATEHVPALPEDPAGLELKGRVAEALQQWELATQLYESLPAGHPGKCEMQRRVHGKRRLSLAPPQVTGALASAALTRRALAALVAWEAPRVLEKATGPVPVFEDVVGLAEGREIVALARAGVVIGDTIARRFNPARSVSPRELIATCERLAAAMGRPAPRWCPEGSGTDCEPRPQDTGGQSAAALIRRVAAEEAEPCSSK